MHSLTPASYVSIHEYVYVIVFACTVDPCLSETWGVQIIKKFEPIIYAYICTAYSNTLNKTHTSNF